MKLKERARLAVKDLEFSLPPSVTRAVGPLMGLRDPYREQERRMRCLFIHVPKAAGTSVAHALFNDKSRHIALSRYFAFDSDAADSFFKFAFVRNPWDRLHSAYHYLARRIGADPRFPDHRWATHYLGSSGDFPGFVQRMARDRAYRAAVRRYIHFRDQADWLSVRGKGMPMDFIGRYESLEADFASACARIGIQCALPHDRARTDGTKYTERYTPESIDFVGSLYARDVRLFDYEFAS